MHEQIDRDRLRRHSNRVLHGHPSPTLGAWSPARWPRARLLRQVFAIQVLVCERSAGGARHILEQDARGGCARATFMASFQPMRVALDAAGVRACGSQDAAGLALGSQAGPRRLRSEPVTDDWESKSRRPRCDC